MPIKEDYLWNCNLKLKDATQLTKYMHSYFWKEVVEAWAVYNNSIQEPIYAEEIKSRIFGLIPLLKEPIRYCITKTGTDKE